MDNNHAEMFHGPDRQVLQDLIQFAKFVSNIARMQREGFLATRKLENFPFSRGYSLAKDCRLCTVIV